MDKVLGSCAGCGNNVRMCTCYQGMNLINIEEREPKQVIIMRKDLNMRKGKCVAQGSHASMSVFFQMMERSVEDKVVWYTMHTDRNGWIDRWKQGRFTKIVVSVDSDAALLAAYEMAKGMGIPCSLITDAGLTEFKGVPTNTCVAIGPWDPAEIDKITGSMPLL